MVHMCSVYGQGVLVVQQLLRKLKLHMYLRSHDTLVTVVTICFSTQVTSYGGKLTYTVMFRLPQNDEDSSGVIRSDVRLEVGDG